MKDGKLRVGSRRDYLLTLLTKDRIERSPDGSAYFELSPKSPVLSATRAAAAIAIGVAAGALCLLRLRHTFAFSQVGDFTPLYVGAKAILHGRDPYAAVALDGARQRLLFYPASALILVGPLVVLPMQWAAVAFVAISASWLAYAVTREAWWPLWLFASAGFYQSVLSVQWAPLLMAGAVTGAPVGLAIAAKPTLALPLLGMQTKRSSVMWGFGIAIGLILVSLAITPAWPARYLRTVRESPISGEYMSAAFTLLGVPCWLAILRWRDWRARLLLGMSIVPLNGWTYAYLPLVLVARSRFQLLLLCIASWVAFFVTNTITFDLTHGNPLVPVTSHILPVAIVGYFWPALVVVLLGPRRSGRAPGEHSSRLH